jgi:hypothetical protein
MSSDLTFITNEQGKNLSDRFGVLLGDSANIEDGVRKFVADFSGGTLSSDGGGPARPEGWKAGSDGPRKGARGAEAAGQD